MATWKEDVRNQLESWKTRPLSCRPVLFLSVVFEPTVANYYSHRLTKTDSHSHVRKTGTKTAENQYKILTAFGR